MIHFVILENKVLILSLSLALTGIYEEVTLFIAIIPQEWRPAFQKQP
jgi:hypothetical protein